MRVRMRVRMRVKVKFCNKQGVFVASEVEARNTKISLAHFII